MTSTQPHQQPPQHFYAPPAAPGPMPPMPYQQQPVAAPQPPARPVDRSWLLGLLSVAAVIAGLSIEENGANQWDHVNAWGGLAIVAAVLTLAPLFGRSFGWTGERARQVAGVGAGSLVLFWVLFTLPDVGTNTSLVTTIGVGAGAAAAALAANRPAS